MTAAGLLIRLYPKSFRDRWEDELRLEADAVGVQGVPDLAAGAISQWLHPTMWPAVRAEQRYSRAAAALTAVTMTTWLLTYLTGEQDETAVPHALNVAGFLMVFAIALITPWPKRRVAALTTVVQRGLGRLAGPLVLGTVVVVLANTNAGPVPAPARQLLLATWWCSLIAFAFQAPRMITDVGDRAVRPAGPARLRASIHLLTAANLAISATIFVRAVNVHHLLPAATAVLIAGLTVPVLIARRDLAALREYVG